MSASFPVSLLCSGFLVFAFLRWDFLTSTVASFTAQATLSAMPFLLADSTRLQLAGGVAVLAAAVPCLVSLRSLTSDREFVYKYEDVPPHVRRIAERERQRVELETARNIQSSILPQLPSQLAGVELAHTYLPATEVGGDFYDVLALDDGRLAVAVGDVAGHGVSSGLVMAMAKSALAVQVSFDPRVESVFATLNRMVFQSARKRLLATLCYALVDPVRREIEFASAGHLFPYRVTPDGKVESLESIAYPLGVRPQLEVVSRLSKLGPGDVIFLCSDGLVEARREGSDEHFGFDRVERTLAAAAGNGAGVVRDRVLAELERFAGDSPREDDLTLLVLKIPA
jgi:sigma-B regulation protein RsbU (phosphoserine phosphatase)